MRARTVLAAVAFAGTVLLGGAGHALADDNDDMGMGNFGAEFGSSPQATPDGHSAPGGGQSGSVFGQSGSVFDKAIGR